MSLLLLGAGLGVTAQPVAAYTAAIEAEGWVLAVRGTWGATPGAWNNSGEDRHSGQFLSGGVDQFPLDPSGTPKVMVTVQRQGFTRSGGAAVASSGDQEVLVATKPLRRPYPNITQLDETDHGDGTRTVRLALSNRVYVGDVVTAATFAAGWKAGEAAVSLSSGITNNSTRALPVAISRWATPSFSLCRGTTNFNVDVIVAAHHPRAYSGANHQAIAALKLTATDGTNTNTYWFTAPQTSPDYGDSLRCWGGTIDLTGLTAGPITIHRTLYPWVGASRTTGSAHSTDATNAIDAAHDVPLMVCYDPSSTLYPVRHVYVDTATGTTTASSVTVATSLASAKAGTAAKDISTALEAVYQANLSLAARNGWAADTARAADWCVVTLAAGAQNFGSTAITSGLNCNDGRLVIQGDPDDADPKANCIWRFDASTPSSKRISRYWVQNLTVECGQSTFGGGLYHFDNVEIRGKSGYESDTSTPFGSASGLPAGWAWLSATRMKWWKFGVGAGDGTNQRFLLIRNSEHNRECESIVHISSSKVVDPNWTARDLIAFNTWNNSSVGNTDPMIWGCRADDWAGRFTSFSAARESGNDTFATPFIFKRMAVVNSFCERSKGNGGERLISVGEGEYAYLQDSIFEGMTMQGNGWNGCYNDSPSPFLNLQHIGNVMRNCSHGRTATKHDKFKADGTLTGSWEYLYGVGFEGNVHGNQNTTDPTDFQFAHFGLRSVVDLDPQTGGNGSNAFMKFTDDNSDYGPDAPTGTGNGDYRPASGAPHLGIGGVACTDEYLGGASRGETVHSGALVAA